MSFKDDQEKKKTICAFCGGTGQGTQVEIHTKCGGQGCDGCSRGEIYVPVTCRYCKGTGVV